MKTYTQIEGKEVELPIWENLPFNQVAKRIIEGVITCPELERYYCKLLDERAKAYELQCLTSH